MNLALIYRIGGILVILSGIESYITGWDGKWGVQMTPLIALMVILSGCTLFLLSFKMKEKPNSGEMICIKCKKKYKTKYVKILACPECDGKLVEFKEMVNNDTDKPVF